MIKTTFNLRNETRDLLQNAIALHDYLHRVEVMSDSVLSSYDIKAQEYRDGLTVLDLLIVDNRFANQHSRDAIHNVISSYRRMIPDERKLTAKRLDAYLERVTSIDDNLFNGKSS